MKLGTRLIRMPMSFLREISKRLETEERVEYTSPAGNTMVAVRLRVNESDVVEIYDVAD